MIFTRHSGSSLEAQGQLIRMTWSFQAKVYFKSGKCCSTLVANFCPKIQYHVIPWVSENDLGLEQSFNFSLAYFLVGRWVVKALAMRMKSYLPGLKSTCPDDWMSDGTFINPYGLLCVQYLAFNKNCTQVSQFLSAVLQFRPNGPLRVGLQQPTEQ